MEIIFVLRITIKTTNKSVTNKKAATVATIVPTVLAANIIILIN